MDRVPDGDDLAVWLTSARQTVEEVKDQQRRAVELQKEVRRLDKLLAKYDADLQSLAVREAAANAEWQVVLSRLNFPRRLDRRAGSRSDRQVERHARPTRRPSRRRGTHRRDAVAHH